MSGPGTEPRHGRPSQYKQLVGGVGAVCAARSGDVYATQVPAGLHVPAQRADAPCAPVYRHSARLYHGSLHHQGARHRLHRLPSHGEHVTHLIQHLIIIINIIKFFNKSCRTQLAYDTK